MLVSANDRRFALFVFLRTGKRWLLLQEKIAFLPTLGISTVAPSTFPTACGKGYWKCAKGEPSQLALAHDAIMFFKNESAASVFIWSPSRKAFRRVWVSD